jgi:uncharacterized protein (DUF1810 family)
LTADPFNLSRFVSAQAGVFGTAVAELRAGRTLTHWMWFIFPQLKGLGLSAMAQTYGITGLDEATAYLEHPVLGPRLKAALDAAHTSATTSLHVLFGSPDDLKFRSSMTLFAIVAPDGPFHTALERWYGGRPDEPTIRRLSQLSADGGG